MLKIQDSDSVWLLKSLTLFGPSFLTALKRAWPVDSQLKKVEKWKKVSAKIDVDWKLTKGKPYLGNSLWLKQYVT